jgi:hypothetical protein
VILLIPVIFRLLARLNPDIDLRREAEPLVANEVLRSPTRFTLIEFSIVDYLFSELVRQMRCNVLLCGPGRTPHHFSGQFKINKIQHMMLAMLNLKNCIIDGNTFVVHDIQILKGINDPLLQFVRHLLVG